MVITSAIPELNPANILYVATFGDPKLYLPEGEGINPDACKGKNLSPYRRYAPNCRTSAGSLGAKIPYQELGWEGKIGLWCRDKDLICGAGIEITSSGSEESLISSAIKSHTSYVSGGQIADIARTIVKKLPAAYPAKLDAIAIESSALDSLDVVFLVDRSYQMLTPIRDLKPAILEAAEKVVALPNGRTGLYSYADYVDKTPVQDLLYLTSTSGLRYAMATIRYNGESTDFAKEISLLPAIKRALREQPWRAGATKSIVIITNRGYRDPDMDGTTLEDIVSLSLSIDPVNIYVVGPEENREKFSRLITSTNGGYYNEDELTQLSTILKNRPSVTFPLAKYTGKPGEEFDFLANVQGDIIKYEWDLDFDGIFEVTTNSPRITTIYQDETSGYIQLRVTTRDGKISTSSAEAVISRNIPEYYSLSQQTISNLGAITDAVSISAPSQEVLVPNCGKH